MHISVRRFAPGLSDAFMDLHCDANEAGWCFCVAWWVPTWEGWGARTAKENHDLRRRLLEDGHYDGYLLFVGGATAGWCQVGPRDRLGKLVSQYGVEKDPQVWAFTCFLIAPAFRRKGLAERLLREVVYDLRARGIQRVEAYPRRGDSLDEAELWTGPEEMYRRVGFQVIRDDPARPILALSMSPGQM